MAVNFKELLSKPVGSIEAPKTLPDGTYYGFIKKFSFDLSRQKKTPYVRYDIVFTRAGTDVEPDQLVGVEIGKKAVAKDFYLTDDSEYILKEFLESIGVEMDPSAGLGDYIPQAVNAEVMCEVATLSNDEGRPIKNVINRIGPAGDGD